MTPGEFIARWGRPLEERARVVFACGPREKDGRNYCDIANDFVESQGFVGIGFNWELLDAEAGPGETRSARGTIADAFAYDMMLPQTRWLGRESARDCAEDFVNLFAPENRTIVSNRLNDLWNPLSRARIEWAFIGFDAVHKVFLMVQSDP